MTVLLLRIANVRMKFVTDVDIVLILIATGLATQSGIVLIVLRLKHSSVINATKVHADVLLQFVRDVTRNAVNDVFLFGNVKSVKEVCAKTVAK